MESLLANKIIWVPAAAWALAQVLKLAIASIREKRFMLSYLTTMGGMPSSHTALVCALATTIAVVEGLGSPLFAVAAFFALIVMYDAAGVRQTVGNQSVMLNRLLDELFKGKAKVNPEFEQRLRELIGHTNFQVIAGALVGIAFALIFTL
ncbi:MAG: divergent PAP2 family protein [Chloroflexi bacterium]|nr:divergent PAP2 family protein [Chloroflexota bacterium]MBM3155168.1 divergent PAP2 family protein [Chloroflexota bacterium]MBM3174359.1 divergent PAP2 family protein [Chloroflexota bacterium]MBM4450962.1 divergent PAP2 family protein [Chloroflexota bacterium]